MWSVEDGAIWRALRFVPDGEPLPPGPDESHWHPTETNSDGIPLAFGWCRGGCVHSVREALAAEAEAREAAS